MMELLKKVLAFVRKIERKGIETQGIVTHKTLFLRTLIEACIRREAMTPETYDAGRIAESLSLVCERYREWLHMAYPNPHREQYGRKEWYEIHMLLKKLADTAWMVREERRTDGHD